MKQAFKKSLHMSRSNEVRLTQINDIIEEYSAKGYTMTLRQLYYQLVSRKFIPNKQSEYSKLSTLLGKGRLGGIVDWSAIEDRIRTPKLPYTVNDLDQAIEDTIDMYRLDRMKTQNCYIEVWIEKDALSNVVYPITSKYGIRLMVNRGYSSITAMYDAYQRFRYFIDDKPCYILYMGDHDPSGLDMIRDVRNRLLEFVGNINKYKESWKDFATSSEGNKVLDIIDSNEKVQDYTFSVGKKRYLHLGKIFYYNKLNVVPIALSKDQIINNDLPPDPAKFKDPRASDYIKEHGKQSWELDALPPDVLSNILEEQILNLIDLNKYNEILLKEKKDIVTLKSITGYE